jgi:hypothetical protein
VKILVVSLVEGKQNPVVDQSFPEVPRVRPAWSNVTAEHYIMSGIPKFRYEVATQVLVYIEASHN